MRQKRHFHTWRALRGGAGVRTVPVLLLPSAVNPRCQPTARQVEPEHNALPKPLPTEQVLPAFLQGAAQFLRFSGKFPFPPGAEEHPIQVPESESLHGGHRFQHGGMFLHDFPDAVVCLHLGQAAFVKRL